MNGEKNLASLIRTMKPILQEGEYVFCTVKDMSQFNIDDLVMFFREEEGYTIILRREFADSLGLAYSFKAAWITLTVHSALDAVGLTAAFSKVLAKENISSNVVAGFYHDHIFVNHSDAGRAVSALKHLSANQSVN